MRGLVSSVLASAVVLTSASAADAQWRWRDDGTVERVGPPAPRRNWDRAPEPWGWDRPYAPRNYQASPYAGPPQGGGIRDGGARPDIAPLAPPVVAFNHAYPAGSIVIDSEGRQLYFVLPNQQAYAYQIAVGREGFDWFGTEVVSRKQAWPDWHPPAEMRQRDPRLPEKMTGGLNNPLGAMALYLGTTLYRIHGTNDERSLGQAGSSGCFRMLNANVLHLASLTEIGTTVHVVRALDPSRVSDAPRTPARAAQAQAQPQIPRAGPAPRVRRDEWYEWERPPRYYYYPPPQPSWPYGWR